MGFHVVLESKAGELDSRFAADDESIRDAIIDLASRSIFADGDVIRVIKAKNPQSHS